MSKTDKANQKSIKTKLADPETYLEIISDCMGEQEKEDLSPHHVANVMALSAELMLTYAGPIGRSFQDQGELDITLKAKLGSIKDTVQIQFKRAAELKDSASAEVPDPNQTEMDFKAGESPQETPDESSSSEEIDDTEAKGLPAPLRALPSPDKVIDAEVIDDESNVEGEEE